MQNTNFTIKTYFKSKITLEFENVSLSWNTTYTTFGLNVLLNQAELPFTNVSIHKLDRQKSTGFVSVTNSTFRHLNVTRGFDISMSDIYIDGSGSHEYGFMYISNCNLSIKAVTINKIQGSSYMYNALIELSNCKIDMQNVNLIDIPDSNILIENYSTIHMNNVYISNTWIMLIKHSSLHIVHSLCEGIISLDIGNNCNLTIANTTVEHHGNYTGPPFLYTKYNAQINILNCTFSNIAPVIVQHSYISIHNSRIGGSQYLIETETKNFIEISYGSHLVVSDTNITHNTPIGMKTFFRGSLKSRLEMYRCLYAWNWFSIHFVADDDSDVTILDSQFVNNNSTFGEMFDMTRNTCFILGCLFEGNEGTNIVYAQSSNLTIISSVFMNIWENGIVVMDSAFVELNNYLEIDNCTVIECGTYFAIFEKVAEISIQNSYVQCSSLQEMIFIFEARTVRIASSKFVTFSQEIISFHTLIVKDINFYTFQSSFGNKTWWIRTNKTDFIKKVTDLGLIVLDGSIISEETGFASCELNVLIR